MGDDERDRPGFCTALDERTAMVENGDSVSLTTEGCSMEKASALPQTAAEVLDCDPQSRKRERPRIRTYAYDEDVRPNLEGPHDEDTNHDLVRFADRGPSYPMAP